MYGKWNFKDTINVHVYFMSYSITCLANKGSICLYSASHNLDHRVKSENIIKSVCKCLCAQKYAFPILYLFNY